jgi:hypothetical protein
MNRALPPEAARRRVSQSSFGIWVREGESGLTKSSDLIVENRTFCLVIVLGSGIGDLC